jgi:uncharacterized protein (TIGR00251 family)
MIQAEQPIRDIPGGVRVNVHAQPGAKRTELSGRHGDAIKIRIQAPPVDGRANEELAKFLADKLGISRSQVRLVRGDKSRSKVFEILEVSTTFVCSVLLPEHP